MLAAIGSYFVIVMKMKVHKLAKFVETRGNSEL